jgi:endonuclease YncB( thermonuclease family)
MWSRTQRGRAPTNRFGSRRPRTGGGAIIAALFLAACYSAIEVATTGSSTKPASQIVGVARVLDGDTIDLDGERIVNESRGQRWFCTEAEARAAGWRSARW